MFHIHSLNTVTLVTFHNRLGEGGRTAALGHLKISHCFQLSLIALLAPHQVEPSKIGDVITPPGPWLAYGPNSRVFKLSILVTWPNHRCRDLPTPSSDKKGFTFTNITSAHCVAKCHAVKSSGKPYLWRLHLILHFFSHYQKSMTIGLNRKRADLKGTAFRCLKASVSWPRNDNVSVSPTRV